MAGIQYTLGKNHLKQAQLVGMKMEADGALTLGSGEELHRVLFPMLDSGLPDCAWGRFCMETELSADAVVYLYVVSSNEREADALFRDVSVPWERKKKCIFAERSSGNRKK
jgi:hypothetical protein